MFSLQAVLCCCSLAQTKEHARLLRSVGVFELVVALNKMDTHGWSETRYEQIQAEVSDFLAQIGYPSLDP